MDSSESRFMDARTAWSAVSENRFDDAADASRPIDVQGVVALRGEPVVTREQVDEFVAAITSPQPRYGARAAADPPIDVRGFVAAIRGEPVITKEQIDEFVAAITGVHEGTYDPSKHPRVPKGQTDGGQWVDKGGGGGAGGGSAGAEGSPSFLDALIRRNQTLASLSGVVTPGMIRSKGIATELQSAARLPGEIARWASDVARAAAAGLGTGGKAVVNGFATAIKSVATLGLNTSQLELIGVTKEDRARGYDTAVSITTASGQVLIAVGTGGMASALSKGGSIARTASGALVAYDAAGNAVGVVQGVYDATQNGVTVSNGTQVAGGLLGLSANVGAAKGLATPHAQPQSPNILFRVGKHGEMPTPRPGQQSHHGVMSAWMEKAYPGYDANKAPAILMPELNHRATIGVYNKWRVEMTQRMGGRFDWSRVSEADMRALSEKMFDAAQVPSGVRRQYWTEFEKMKAAMRK